MGSLHYDSRGIWPLLARTGASSASPKNIDGNILFCDIVPRRIYNSRGPSIAWGPAGLSGYSKAYSCSGIRRSNSAGFTTPFGNAAVIYKAKFILINRHMKMRVII
jgi:hypothetical protein